MAKVVFSKAPQVNLKKNHTQFRPWLLLNHYDKICGYCFVLDTQLSIDHYEPKDYAPRRAIDPTNLLLGCSRCNSPSGKWHYHPLSTKLSKRNGESHYIHNIRIENLTTLFSLSKNGTISIQAGLAQRAQWLIVLFDLNDPTYVLQRSFLFGSIAGALKLINAGATVVKNPQLHRFLDHIARNLITVYAFDITLDNKIKLALKNFVTSNANKSKSSRKKKAKVKPLKGKNVFVNAKKKKSSWRDKIKASK